MEILNTVNRVADKLRREIARGDYAFGERLTTERDLAKKLRVSRGTLRQALNLLAKERLVVRQQGRGTFIADPAYAPLNSSAATLIAALVYEREYYFEPVIQAAAAEASRCGYVLATGTNATMARETEHVHAFLRNRIRGLIMTPNETGDRKNYDRLILENIPVVLIDGLFADRREDYVVVDNRAGTVLAVEHLVAKGHRRIAYLGHNLTADLPCRPERRRGFLEACHEVGLNLPDEWVLEINPRETVSALSKLLKGRDRPTGLVAYNDSWAVEAISAARKVGRCVPTDLAVVGFDDSVEARTYEIPLTSICPEPREMGIAAVDLLINKIENDRPRPKRGVLITPRLVVRQST